MKVLFSGKKRRVFLLSANFLIILLVLISCRKKESSIGAGELTDQALSSAQIDTFELTTYCELQDSVITDNPTYALLGSYVDPKFGKVDASFYTQVGLPAGTINFGDISTITVDSVVMGIDYADSYGSLTSQTIEVYQLTEDINIDSTYYNFTTKNHSSVNLVASGHETITPNPTDEILVGTDTIDAQMRIYLDNSLGTQLINEAVNGTAFSSNDDFFDYFKGLYVKVNNPAQTSGTGGIFSLNLNADNAGLTIYYSQSGTNKTFTFDMSTDCADFNHVEVDYTGKQINTVLNNPSAGMQEFYAQAFQTRGVIEIPGLANIPSNAVIYKAELVLPIQYQAYAKYAPSTYISIGVKIDGVLVSTGAVGTYTSSEKAYIGDIRDYVQALASDLVDVTKLYVAPSSFNSSVERIVFNGPNTINKLKPKIIVTYTTY